MSTGTQALRDWRKRRKGIPGDRVSKGARLGCRMRRNRLQKGARPLGSDNRITTALGTEWHGAAAALPTESSAVAPRLCPATRGLEMGGGGLRAPGVVVGSALRAALARQAGTGAACGSDQFAARRATEHRPGIGLSPVSRNEPAARR